MAKIYVNAWREVITRVFEDFEVQYNIKPDWLVNPITNKHLKLNMYYPEIGLAVYLSGLKSRHQRRRLSMEDEQNSLARDRYRYSICEQNGICLADLNLSDSNVSKPLVELELAMSRTTQQIFADEDMHETDKIILLERMALARRRVHDFKNKIKSDTDLGMYMASWNDRKFRESEPSPTPAPISKDEFPIKEGMIIEHNHFGHGLVCSVTSSSDDVIVIIEFDDEKERKFMGSLLLDKIKLVS